MRKIILDCDNTMGIQGCDVDDGLALLYLLGDPDVELMGITTTYGNNTTDKVHRNTEQMLQDIGREGLPLYKGGTCAGDYESEAAGYLAEMAGKYAGELELLVTGTTTNLYGAWLCNPLFFRQIKKIVMMGGITAPLIFEKKQMEELNLSQDTKATYKILTSGADVAVVTGNSCMKVLFTHREYQERFAGRTEKAASYIKSKTDYWFEDNMNDYGIQGFYNWDVVAAVYLLHPELFCKHTVNLCVSEEDLETGWLRACGGGAGKSCVLEMPEIGEETAFKNNIYETWMKVQM